LKKSANIFADLLVQIVPPFNKILNSLIFYTERQKSFDEINLSLKIGKREGGDLFRFMQDFHSQMSYIYMKTTIIYLERNEP